MKSERPFDKEKLIEKLKRFLKERSEVIKPVGPEQSKTYTVKDLYSEAMRYMKEEVQRMKKAPLTEAESLKLEQIAKTVSNEVVKEMKI